MTRSLVQERMSIDRTRHYGMAVFSFGVILVLAGLIQANSDSPPSWFYVFLPVFFLVTGLRALVRARRRRIEFEAAHGRDAGQQPAIR